jgi:hypothetical protein
MSIKLKLKSLRYYQRKTAGTIVSLKKDSLYHRISNTFVAYSDKTSKNGELGFFYYGELPQDVAGKKFRLIEVVNTQRENRIIPDAQCLYLQDKRRFFFSRRTGRSWEVAVI